MNPVKAVKATAKWLVALPHPEEHGEGPFVLFDKKGQPAGITKTYDEAVTTLHEQHNMGGTIFRANDLTDVSPQVRFRDKFGQVFHHQSWAQYPNLQPQGGQGQKPQDAQADDEGNESSPGRMGDSDKQLVQSLSGMQKGALQEILNPDLDKVPWLIEQLNKMPLKVVDRHNQKNPRRTKKIEVTEDVKVDKVRRIVIQEDVPTTITLTSREEVPYATDDWEPRPIKGFGEITRVVPKWQLGLPSEYWAPKVLVRDLQVQGYYETAHLPMEIMQRMPVEKTEHYTETKQVKKIVEIPDDTQGQLLYILTDWSPSMHSTQTGDCDPRRLPVAIALASVVVGCHLHDGSRYFARSFTTGVSRRLNAEDEVGKMQLITQFMSNPSLGGGTDFVHAVQVAAEEIRQLRQNDDEVPEVLLITDGENTVYSGEIAEIIGRDVKLHTVMVNSSNSSLRYCSTTYTELLVDDAGNVTAY